MKKVFILVIAIIFILIGVTLFCYPYISNYFYTQEVDNKKEEFIEKTSDKNNENILDSLYNELKNRNKELYEHKQDKLIDPFSYEQPSIDLSQYGIQDNIIGYIYIPKIEIQLPILLGANNANMKKGAVHLTETSYPIGGENTNSVIASHRGYNKAVMFRYINKLQNRDKIYIRNFKEELVYEVYETKIILPNDIKELEIQKEQDIITLVTCHPYRVNTQRYVVKAKRVT